MIYYKCPLCGGDLHKDENGDYECLNCGYIRFVMKPPLQEE